MNFPSHAVAPPLFLSPQTYQGRRILLESQVASAIGVSTLELRQLKRQYAECFPGSCAFSLSAWEVLQRWPDACDDGEELAETNVVYTETGAAMAAVLLRAQTSPERIATLLRAFQSA